MCSSDLDKPPVWLDAGREFFLELMNDLRNEASQHAILCHNTLFDGAILSWKYGIKPKAWLDTLSMARAIHGVDAGGSLKALAQRYELGQKGEEVIHAIGKRRQDFDVVGIDRYGDYCCNDVDITRRLFDRLSVGFPVGEIGRAHV